MRLNWDKIKATVSMPILILQGVFIISILLYALNVMQGGVFSTFYCWLFALACGLIVTGVTFFKKHLIIGAIDLAAFILVFLHLYSIPF